MEGIEKNGDFDWIKCRQKATRSSLENRDKYNICRINSTQTTEAYKNRIRCERTQKKRETRKIPECQAFWARLRMCRSLFLIFRLNECSRSKKKISFQWANINKKRLYTNLRIVFVIQGTHWKQDAYNAIPRIYWPNSSLTTELIAKKLWIWNSNWAIYSV